MPHDEDRLGRCAADEYSSDAAGLWDRATFPHRVSGAVTNAKSPFHPRVFQIPQNTPAADGKPVLMGWAMLDQATYADVAGDGQTDAVVEVDSGGTAGIAGFFVYRLTDSTPQLLDGRAGFALEAYIDPNAHALYLLGTAPPAPFHPRNAAAGVWRETYTLVGDRLVEQGSCTYIPMAEDVHVPQGQCVP